MEPLLTRHVTPADAMSRDFEVLVCPHLAEMYRAAAALVGPDDAGDVAQEALIEAWRHLRSLRDPGAVRPWLHAIVINRSRDAIRRQRRRPRWVNVDPDGPGAGSMPGDLAIAAAQRDQLDRAFARLSIDDRAVLTLRYTLGMTVPDVAAALGIPDGTVKSRTHAAVARMRAFMPRETIDD